MKVIVTYRNFHDIERIEIMPEVFFVRENETSEDALRRIWENEFNSAISESMFDETTRRSYGCSGRYSTPGSPGSW